MWSTILQWIYRCKSCDCHMQFMKAICVFLLGLWTWTYTCTCTIYFVTQDTFNWLEIGLHSKLIELTRVWSLHNRLYTSQDWFEVGFYQQPQEVVSSQILIRYSLLHACVNVKLLLTVLSNLNSMHLVNLMFVLNSTSLKTSITETFFTICDRLCINQPFTAKHRNLVFNIILLPKSCW